MRLICPNCGAQYEVDDSVIPEQGRDVQCSNCGHSWFQQPAHRDAELAEELGMPLPDTEDTAIEEIGVEESNAEDDRVEDAVSGMMAAEAEAEPELSSEPERRGLDPDVANVLREEAEREAAARQAEAEGLESQPELGLKDAAEDSSERSAAARARMARLRGLDETSPEAEAAAAAGASAASRKELLPDVEEINSSLRASEDRDGGAPGEDGHGETGDAPRRRGGRWLSRLIILVVFLGLIVYVLAPLIVEHLPQAEPYLRVYVDWANGLRAQIDQLIQAGAAWVQDMIGGTEGGDPATE